VPDDSDPVDLPDSDVGEPETVAVEPPRELRGVWVATVSNIDFPSTRGLSAAQGRAELASMLDVLADARFNAVFFQVRPEGDALYRSSLEPWSRYLTGTQGGDPGWDPLEELVAGAHARGIEVHVWLNPYRAGVNAGNATVAPHLAKTNPEAVVRYGDLLWMDPGQRVVQDRLVAVVDDLVARYDLDGVHFDDYFYPYPIDGTPFPDAATYQAYQRAGGGLALADWRRQNVNQMVARVASSIRGKKPWVRFGISPFGIYRPGQPEGISGFDAYAGLYADPVAWAQAGDVDYLAPQLYWPTTQTRQAFEPLVRWWSQVPGEQDTYAGLYLSKLGSSSSWTLAEFGLQVDLSRTHQPQSGNLWFSYKPLGADTGGIRAYLRQGPHARLAVVPPIPRATGDLAPPTVTWDRDTLEVSHSEPLAGFLVFEDGELVQRFAGNPASMKLGTGTWAVAALHRDGRTSRGVVVEVEP
jgi:uncharacterized lipoprotein YddW (UPF0748 family)